MGAMCEDGPDAGETLLITQDHEYSMPLAARGVPSATCFHLKRCCPGRAAKI